jgi:hypothetical protein
MKLNPVSAAPPTITEVSAHRRKLRLSNFQFTRFSKGIRRFIEAYRCVYYRGRYKGLDKFQVWKSAIQMQIDEDMRKKAVIRALLDDHSRLILTATTSAAKSVIAITHEQKIPITSAYRRVKELKEFGLLKVERIVLTPEGKKFELLRSTIRTASIQFDKGTLNVDVTAGIEADEKLVKRFFALREAK